MTARSVAEWIGATPDAKIPPRVQLRVWTRAKGCCEAGCGRKLGPGDTWELDHITALVNGGEHRERNLRIACSWCHRAKTNADVAEKARIDRKRKKAAGIPTCQSRPIPGSKASGWRKPFNGPAERRHP